MLSKTFRYVRRPSDSAHGYPAIVFDQNNQIHLPLTVFAKEVNDGTSQGTATTYLNSILPFFTWLQTDQWQIRSQITWNDTPERIRQAIYEYLIQKMSCKVHQHKYGFQVVDVTENSRSTVRVFLSALKFFYGVMVNKKYYPFENNPLIDAFSLHVITTSKDYEEHNDAFPSMPSISGIEDPKKRKRLSDSYFRLQGEKWVPQIIDDVKLPGLILLGGSRLKGWGLREECITRMLFESGGRVSEVLGLTLGDWHNRGLLKEANAFNKGSNGRRVKFLRWNNETTKLLLRYFDTERYQYDPNKRKLKDFLRMNQRKEIDLQTVPLFLSNRGTIFTSKTYREIYWNPACKNAGIDADVHQARHWYVTMAMRTIYEFTDNNTNIQRKLRELIEYMKWRKGWEMIEVYQHYFDVQRHLEIQDKVHKLMEKSKKEALNPKKSPTVSNRDACGEQPIIDTKQISNDDFNFLMRIGGGK